MISRIVSGVSRYTSQAVSAKGLLAKVGLKAAEKPSTLRHAVSESMKAFEASCPIASRVFKRDEIIKGAILTRFVVAFARVYVNVPKAETKVDLTRSQKYQSFFERIFMEVFGSILQVGTLFFSQEFISQMLERTGFCNAPSAAKIKAFARQFHPEIVKTTPAEALDRGTKAIAFVLNDLYRDTKGSIAKKLTNPSAMRKLADDIDLKVLQQLSQFVATNKPMPRGSLAKLHQLTQTALNQHLFRLRQAGLLTLGVGVLSAAIVAGYVNQKLNDTVFSNKIVPSLLRTFGIVPKGQSDFNYVRYQLPTIRERIFWI